MGGRRGQLPQRITMQSWQRGTLTGSAPRCVRAISSLLGLGSRWDLDYPSALPLRALFTPLRAVGERKGTLVLALDVALPISMCCRYLASWVLNFQATHHASMALTYQIHHPLPPRSPLAAHLDLGAVVDFYQSLFPSNFFGTVHGLTPRVGPRLGIGALSRYAGLTFFGDLPLSPYVLDSGRLWTDDSGYAYEYRLTVLVTVEFEFFPTGCACCLAQKSCAVPSVWECHGNPFCLVLRFMVSPRRERYDPLCLETPGVEVPHVSLPASRSASAAAKLRQRGFRIP